MELPQEEIDRRRELRIGLFVGALFYFAGSAASCWLLGVLHYNRQQLLGVPILAMTLSLLVGCALRGFSERIATGFVVAGVCALPIAALLVQVWLD